jgi:hypothetical protein
MNYQPRYSNSIEVSQKMSKRTGVKVSPRDFDRWMDDGDPKNPFHRACRVLFGTSRYRKMLKDNEAVCLFNSKGKLTTLPDLVISKLRVKNTF